MKAWRVAIVALLLTAAASSASAADRFAVVISGASAGDAYARQYDAWRASIVASFRQQFHYPDDHCLILSESGQGSTRATREGVGHVFSDLRARLTKDDLLFVILIGHGSVDEDDAKFNLVGPDLSAQDWAELLQPLPGRLIFIDTTGGSFPFLRRLAMPGRVVLTATESSAQQFETIFPGHFAKALEDPAADSDKNGLVSVWEAFNYASAAVRQSFQQRGQLPTERAVIDDSGAGVGRDAQNPGPGGALARAVYFAQEASTVGDAALLQRRADLQRQLDDLRLRKASASDPARYDQDIERVLVELARIARQLREDPQK
jgi:hypothetical protein